MPIYAYRCGACGHSRDVLQKLSDPLLTTCPVCGAEAFSKQVTAAGFQLKGSGWYVTDFRDNGSARKPDAKADDKADGKADDKADGKADGKPETGSAAKPEAKPDGAAPAGPAAVSAPSSPPAPVAAPAPGPVPPQA